MLTRMIERITGDLGMKTLKSVLTRIVDICGSVLKV